MEGIGLDALRDPLALTFYRLLRDPSASPRLSFQPRGGACSSADVDRAPGFTQQPTWDSPSL